MAEIDITETDLEKRLREAFDQFADIYLQGDWLIQQRFYRLLHDVVRIATTDV